MKLEYFSLASPVDGLPLKLTVAKPDGEVKGVIQILHGMCEYIGRYTTMMEWFAARGYVVAGIDHRGHGESVRAQSDLGWFYDKRGKAIVQDAVFVTDFLKKAYPCTEITLFGHSMGSMVAYNYLQGNDGLPSRVILSGAPSKNPVAGVAVVLADTVALLRGKRHRSKLLYSLSIGAYDKRFKAEGRAAWLTVNRKNVEKYLADPYCSYTFTCNGFRNLFCLLRNSFQRRRYAVQNPDLPIFYLAGGDDPVIVSEKSWRKAQAFLRKVGYRSVEGTLYQGFRHELLNEADPTVYYQEILSFIER